MIITCPNCQTRYNLPEDRLAPGGSKVKCSKCAHVFKAAPPTDTPEEEVESLLEDEGAKPHADADQAFAREFDEAMGQDTVEESATEKPTPAPAPEEPASEPASESEEEEPLEEPSSESEDDAFADVDDLFDDAADSAEEAEEGPGPDAPARDTVFEGDEDDLFADEDGDEDDDSLFEDGEDDEPGDDLFEDGDDQELEDDGDEPEDLGLDQGGFSLDGDSEEKPERKKGGKSLGCLIVLLILILGSGAAIYFQAWKLFGLDPAQYFRNVPYVGAWFADESATTDVEPGESPAERLRKIELKNVKQYYVVNEKSGNLFVVEGKAVNRFSTPKERIRVEVALYDAQGNALATRDLLCGNVLSQFQLEVQTREEIEQGLQSEVGILSNNTFIRPGSAAPFMAVFFEPPAEVKEFMVKVVDAADPE
ncbi:DUF3426 domain-containing protein [Pseudodesulfovibrio tunisiensis]|uniref:DUF3426 domain-containing protein n=1 Tax=Pseudodesulfovibrio tunisiensis TaxID=463192 RepID=UPI001FB44E75|nr:DUF3426 domain-containing protein [Pseudodesulfovibrio tunisiensis]